MSDFLREISAKIGFDVDTAGIEHMNHKLEGMHQSLEILAGAEILHGLFEIAEKFGGMAEQLETAAASAGITVEAFQQLSFAASQSGVGSDKLGFALNQLSRQIEQAREGGEGAAAVFAKIGISPEQLAGFANSEAAFKAIADRIAAIEDPIKRTQTAMKIFGRGGAKLVRFLKEGSEGIEEKTKQAAEMGAVLSGEQVESLAELEDTVAALGAVIKAAFGTIATYAAPIIKEVVHDLEGLWTANRAIIETSLEDWFVSLASAIGFTVGIVQGIVKDIKSFIDTFPTLSSGIASTVKWLIIISAAASLLGNVFGLVGSAISVVSGIMTAILSPIGLVVIGIGSIIALSHDLWTMWKGGSFWKDTWIGQALSAIGKFGGGMYKDITGNEFAFAKPETPEEKAANDARRAASEKERTDKYSTFGARLRKLAEIDASPSPATMGVMAQPDGPKFDMLAGTQALSFENTFNIQAPAGGDAAQLASLIRTQFDQAHTQMMQQAKDVLQKPRVM